MSKQIELKQKSSVSKASNFKAVGTKAENSIETKFQKILGTASEDLGFLFVCQAMGAMGFIKDSNPEQLEQVMAVIFAAIQGIGPKNEVEAMLSV
jgi:hypothetical protein